MNAPGLLRLLRWDLRRTRGALFTAGVGIAVGVSALVFFLALGLGTRAVLLGDVFPIHQVDLEPMKSRVGLYGLLGGFQARTVPETAVDALNKHPGVAAAYPKLRLRFPTAARGGQELVGREIRTGEMMGDGVDPVLIRADLADPERFADPLEAATEPCKSDDACTDGHYCERPVAQALGKCSRPVPVVVSRYLVEIFDHGIAASHGLPPIAGQLLEATDGIPFRLTLGRSLLGKAPRGSPRTVHAEVVGVSDKAIAAGITLPLSVVERWNAEFAFPVKNHGYSSVVVELDDPSQSASVIAEGARFDLLPADTRARDVSVLLTGVLVLLGLVSAVVLGVAALNIAHTFRVLVHERLSEIGLYRALGATGRDMRLWMVSLAVSVGVLGGAVGTLIAWLGSLLVDWRASVDLPEFPFKPDSFFLFPGWLLALGMGFSALFALLGALGPASRAAATDPATALARSR